MLSLQCLVLSFDHAAALRPRDLSEDGIEAKDRIGVRDGSAVNGSATADSAETKTRTWTPDKDRCKAGIQAHLLTSDLFALIPPPPPPPQPSDDEIESKVLDVVHKRPMTNLAQALALMTNFLQRTLWPIVESYDPKPDPKYVAMFLAIKALNDEIESIKSALISVADLFSDQFITQNWDARIGEGGRAKGLGLMRTIARSFQPLVGSELSGAKGSVVMAEFLLANLFNDFQMGLQQSKHDDVPHGIFYKSAVEPLLTGGTGLDELSKAIMRGAGHFKIGDDATNTLHDVQETYKNAYKVLMTVTSVAQDAFHGPNKDFAEPQDSIYEVDWQSLYELCQGVAASEDNEFASTHLIQFGKAWSLYKVFKGYVLADVSTPHLLPLGEDEEAPKIKDYVGWLP
mmetsp:Transcript_63750/g.151978  ORF Transcript_63750/g.151978 Transcript_63750/m.151978 type:complete len:400 (+) Transcript_63750:139-1338(+)